MSQKSYQKKLVGVFGDPVDDNPSVVIEQAAFDHENIPMEYLTIQVKKGDLEDAVKGMKAMNFSGINITMPHKIEILSYLDHVAEDAKIMGAVNTVYNKDGKLYGENTDGKGFIRSLKDEKICIQGKKAVILGAGGAARAITVELANEGAKKISVVNGSKENGEKLVNLLNENTDTHAEYIQWNKEFHIPEDTDILINATPIGFLDPMAMPEIPYEEIHSEMIVCDVIPNRKETEFLKEAKKKGCRTFHGMQMLVNQGAIAFELWTGKKAPVEVMLQALEEEYKER